MQIEKTVIHRFQREREGKMPVALGRWRNTGRRTSTSFGLACEFAFDLGKTRHGAERHV